MFSGIVEGLGEVENIEKTGNGKRFHINLGNFSKNLKISQSVCISGCCLTVIELDNNTAAFDVMPETLSKTYFENLEKNHKVNIERSLRVGDEVGGHFVTGHIDCTGKIIRRKDSADFSEMLIEFPKQFCNLLIDKGSIAVDGISLTVVKAGENRFSIALIPHTLKLTTLGFKKEGDMVNIEFDQLAKYIAKVLKSGIRN